MLSWVYLLSLVFVSLLIKHWDTPAPPFTHQFLRHLFERWTVSFLDFWRRPGRLKGRMHNDALNFTLTAVFEAASEGGYTCHFEELPEVFSEGETIEEARANLFDALKEVMEYHRLEARKTATEDAVREPIQLIAA